MCQFVLVVYNIDSISRIFFCYERLGEKCLVKITFHSKTGFHVYICNKALSCHHIMAGFLSSAAISQENAGFPSIFPLLAADQLKSSIRDGFSHLTT